MKTVREYGVTFDENRPFPFVKDCGRFLSEEAEGKVYRLSCALTEEEEASPYARYYRMGPAMPDEENIRATEYNAECDPKKAFLPEEYVQSMDVEGCSKLKSGYCIMPNGVGFAIATTFVPGCTAQIMTNFLENYNPPCDLYYKTWFPGGHVRHYRDVAIEDAGFGMCRINFA
ncbi:MAG: hypothetical protein LUI07_03560, partial [Lachnospiraceae bacterium]|nr:hypothetical protein [Lachnospiraceae bacterium]